MSNPALWRLKVSEQDAFAKPFKKECPICKAANVEYRFSHYREEKGFRYAVYYCSNQGCFGEHLAPVGPRQ